MKIRNITKLTEYKCSKPLVTAAILHWLLTFATDRIFFEYSLLSFGSTKEIIFSLYAWAVKAVFLCLLLAGYQAAGYIVKKCKEKDSAVRRRMWYTGIYFLMMLVLLFAVYPGAWRMDEFGILRDAKTLLPTFWQGYLTSYFYIFSLMLLPIPAGVVLVQCMVISFVIGYVCEKTQKILKLKHKVWLLLPFFAFPVLDSNMYPMRMSVYVFLELLLAAMFVFVILEKRTFSKTEQWMVVVLTAIVSVWRTESIYYIVWIPIVFFVVFWKKEQKRRKIQFVIQTVLVTLIVMAPQTMGNKMVSGDQYEITSMVLPMAPLLCEAEKAGDTKLIETIDKVMDTKIMIDGYESGKSGISVFWSEPLLIREDYSASEYKEFKSAYHKLIMKYPGIFLKERMETFLNSNGILMNTAELYDTDEVPNYVEFREAYRGNHPISISVRKTVLSVLELRSLKDYNTKLFAYEIVWNVMFPLFVLTAAAVVCLIKRKWGFLFILLGIIGKVPLIFLTAPSLLFMYYYGIYLIGNVVFIYGIYLVYGKVKRKPGIEEVL